MLLFHVQWKLSLSSRKTVTSQNWLLIFFGKETHSETKSLKSSRISTKKSYNNNGKPWKSSKVLRVCSQISSFFHFSLVFLICSSFFFIFIIFTIFFMFFFIFSFPCFPFCFFFLIFSFVFLSVGAQNLIFFEPQFRFDFS